jgi:hypothetical protein
MLEPHRVRIAEAVELLDGDEEGGERDARTIAHRLSAFDVNADVRSLEPEGDSPIGARDLTCR